MKHRVSELEGALLDAAVAKALGWKVEGAWCTDPARPNDMTKLGEPGAWAEGAHFAPSRRWQDGGPIIERERIDLWPPLCVGDYEEWKAHVGGRDWGESGPTPLIAAMRAYVASRFGETVELP